MNYIFGPVFSRRLGFSLGVDLVPYKVCSMDCVYCESGKTTVKTCERKEYVPIDKVKEELIGFLKVYKGKIDFITFSGYGEPTLNVGLGRVSSFIKNKFPHIKTALITNSSILYREDVIKDLHDIDLILPSFDAASEDVFRQINLPYESLTASQIREGLLNLKKVFKGEIWLETLFVKGVNDFKEEIKEIGCFVRKLRPDRWQINTVVRPPAYGNVEGYTYEELEEIKKLVNYPFTDILLKREEEKNTLSLVATEEKILNTIKRRPSPFEELSNSLGMDISLLETFLIGMEKKGKIKFKIFNGESFVFPGENDN